MWFEKFVYKSSDIVIISLQSILILQNYIGDRATFVFYFAFFSDKTSKSDMKILLSILVIMVSTLVPNISGFYEKQYPHHKNYN